MTEKQANMYQNLWNQVHKTFDWRTHHQGKRGNERYREGLRAFSKHLAIEYGSKHFRNISDQHLRSFVEVSKEANIGTSTIKTDLSAIRKLHQLLPKKRHDLPQDNKAFQLEKRRLTGIDRAWTNQEVTKAYEHAQVMERNDVIWGLGLARTLGLRMEEATALTKTQIRNALTNGYLHLTKTKGGVKRDVPLNAQSTRVLQQMLHQSPSEKIFVKHGRTHTQAMKRIQNWIGNHRHVFQQNDVKRDHVYQQQLKIDVERPNLTFHGLRHAYARENYQKFLKALKNEKKARLEVSKLLGHGRDDVTKIYLG